MSASQRTQQRLGRIVCERYRLDAIEDLGPFGVTYRAEDLTTGQPVALRVLYAEMDDLPDMVRRFERDLAVGTVVTHPAVAAVTDRGRFDDGSRFCVVEHFPGMTLHELVRRGPLEPARAVDIAKQIAQGLDALHQHDIVDRDLKPRSVMVVEGPPDRVKLVRFGCAQLPVALRPADDEDDTTDTDGDVPIGTVGFMAPEAAIGPQAIGKASDLYALGVMLYEMLTGKHPYDEQDTAALFLRHQLHPPPTFAERAPDCAVPPAVEAVVQQLLAKAPEDRPPSAAAVVVALDAALSDEASAEPTTAAADEFAGDRISDVMDISQVVDQRDSIELIDNALVGAPPVHSAERRSSPPVDLAQSPPASPVGPGQRGRRTRAWRGGRALVAALTAVLLLVLVVPELRARIAALLGGRQAAPTAGGASGSPSAPAASAPEPTSRLEPTAPMTSAPSATARPTAVAGLDEHGWREQLRMAAQSGAGDQGVAALRALAAIHPAAFAEASVARDAVAVAVARAATRRLVDDDVLSLFAAEQLGSAGPDILYQIVAGRGGSTAAQQAAEFLQRPQVRARATAALRIALALRETSCADKLGVLDRVASAGDLRALDLLRTYRPPACTTGGGCCLSHEPRYQGTLLELSKRLGSQRAP